MQINMYDGRIKGNDKSKLSDFNLEEIRGWIINQMYNIEFQIDFIIADYFNPSNKIEFRKIILNSSIVTIGGKMKILKNIKSFDTRIIDKIQKISVIRNAFAHLPATELVDINISSVEKGEFERSEISKIITQIEIMTSSGELKMRNATEMINEFFDMNEQIGEYLLSNDYSKK